MQVEEAERKIHELKLEIELLKTTILQSENELLKNVIEDLKETISSNTRHIEALSEKINQTSNTCEICNYEASSVTVLKSHMTRKHKHQQGMEEQLREYSSDTSQQFSPVSSYRSEMSWPNSSTSETIYYKHSEDKFQCMYCDETLHIPKLEEHVINVHKTFNNCLHCEARIPAEETLLTFHLEVCTTPCPGPPGCPCCKHNVSVCKTCDDCALEFKALQP